MAEIIATVTGATLPTSIVVRRVGEETGNRCIENCNNFPVTFTEDGGNGDYYFIITDSLGCIVDSRNIVGGINSVNCDVIQPSFIANIVQPICNEDGEYTQAVLQLTQIQNGQRYKICYNSPTFTCATCLESDGNISSSSLSINLSTPTIPTSRSVLIRVYVDNTCESAYKEWFGTIITPTCEGQDLPDFSAEAIQPYCSLETGGTVQNAVLKLRDIVNATRYSICYNTSSYNCNCSTDGVIVGNSVDISLTPPNQGIVQDVAVRVINGSTCDYYKDFIFSMRSPKCSEGELTVMNLDLQVFFGDSGPKCDQPNTYDVEYDFYITSNTPGLTENGVQVKTTTGSQRTLPTGNDVPNVIMAAGFKMLCGNPGTAGSPIGTGFYRFTWNMGYLKSKYPLINEFIFDVYANKTKDLFNTATTNTIRPRINAFSGIAMIKQFYSNNAHDAFRIPSEYSGVSCNSQSCPSSPLIGNTTLTIPDVKYKTNISGARKIGTIRFNYVTNKVLWTETT